MWSRQRVSSLPRGVDPNGAELWAEEICRGRRNGKNRKKPPGDEPSGQQRSSKRAVTRVKLVVYCAFQYPPVRGPEEPHMNWDRVEGNWNQFTGKLQQRWGKLTDDDLQQVKGSRTEL